MPLAGARIRNQPRKLRKSLKKLLQDLSAERVHQVRTRIRRLEALVHALDLTDGMSGGCSKRFGLSASDLAKFAIWMFLPILLPR
jgi:hypothetical protein